MPPKHRVVETTSGAGFVIAGSINNGVQAATVDVVRDLVQAKAITSRMAL
jgi:hypothetical protein